MRVTGATDEAVSEAASIIGQGGLVAFPTETVYGLGADALNPMACARIFEVKNRPRFDPLIVHITDVSRLHDLCAVVNTRASELAGVFWPGPLTLVLPKSDLVPGIVTAELDTVAVRVPANPVALRLLEESGTPIAAPSANPFGYISPTTAQHVEEQLGERVDLILDGGECRVGVESTIIDLTGEDPALLRAGGLSLEDIEAVIGSVDIPAVHPEKPIAPGQLPSHYSPRTRLVIVSGDPVLVGGEARAGLLAFRTPTHTEGYAAVEVLSPEDDVREAAANLFGALHRLDNADLDIIYAEPVPESGLGRAIMDRLRRAAQQ